MLYMKSMEQNRERKNKIFGCLLGGAIGDALGYPVEFLSFEMIKRKYGNYGICNYEVDISQNLALISDDTQMTLFTANGLLVADTYNACNNISKPPKHFVQLSYLDWLKTQHPYIRRGKHKNVSWLLDVPELYSLRAPGNTCITALEYQSNTNVEIDEYILNPQNKSKGCGGIMRVAPVALNYNLKIEELDMEGAEVAAITHGHSLGYMSAAVLTHIINRIVYPVEGISTLKEIILDARNTIADMFAKDAHLNELIDVINLAIRLSETTSNDLENIRRIGQGWVAEETLGIAIYCSLKYQNNFSSGVIAAVNHDGDSDSTGAVTGNILGALLGFQEIEEKWKNNLELYDVILEIAEDLYLGCPKDNKDVRYEVWILKYLNATWKKHIPSSTKICAILGDITKVSNFQAIVNAANTSLLGGGGVDGAIHKAAGPELLEECKKLHGCQTGFAKITGGYNLSSDYIIHTVGPVWRGGTSGEEELLESCYRNVLLLAKKNGIRSIAFPSISTGLYHFPVEKAAEIAIDTVKRFIRETPDAFDIVIWVLYDERTYEAYQEKCKVFDM